MGGVQNAGIGCVHSLIIHVIKSFGRPPAPARFLPCCGGQPNDFMMFTRKGVDVFTPVHPVVNTSCAPRSKLALAHNHLFWSSDLRRASPTPSTARLMTKTTHGLAAADVSLYKTASRGYHDRSPSIDVVTFPRHLPPPSLGGGSLS